METKKIKTFRDKRHRQVYLDNCEEIFATAEDFLRDEDCDEALILKEAFREITHNLSEKDTKDLQSSMDDRGL